MEVTEQIEHYFTKGIDLYFGAGVEGFSLASEDNSYSDALLERIKPLVSGFFNEFRFSSAGLANSDMGGSPTKKVLRQRTKTLNYSNCCWLFIF